MVTNIQVFAVAKKYLGKGGAKFRSYCGLGSGQPWCAAFVTYIFKEAGAASLFLWRKESNILPECYQMV